MDRIEPRLNPIRRSGERAPWVRFVERAAAIFVERAAAILD